MSIRQERANAEVVKALVEIFRTKINDPRLKDFITITYAKVSPDFRYCKVGISAYKSKNKSQILSLIKKCEGFIKHELIQLVDFPYTPKLDFVYDEGAEHSEKINDILKNLNIPKNEDNEEI